MASSHLGDDANDDVSDVSTEYTLFHDHLFPAHKKLKTQHTATTEPKPIDAESDTIGSDGELVDLELSLAPSCSYKIIRLFGVYHRVKADHTNGRNQEEEEAGIDHQERGIALVAVVENHPQEEPALAVQPLAAVVEEPNFTIMKDLQNSDVSQLCRLLLAKKLAEAHVMRFLSEEEKASVNSKEGLRVVIRDIDTGSDHQLRLKKHTSSRSYVVIDNWRKEFVKRRDLRWGDGIGMYWHVQQRCLCFSVRRRGPPMLVFL